MKYHLKATVNYPNDEADTIYHEVPSQTHVSDWVTKLLVSEADAISFVITVVKKPCPQQR